MVNLRGAVVGIFMFEFVCCVYVFCGFFFIQLFRFSFLHIIGFSEKYIVI